MCLNLHLIDHPMMGLCAQPSDHGGCVAHLSQGRLNPLMALGRNLPRGSLDRIIHHKQRFTRICRMGPREAVLTQVKLVHKGRAQGHSRGLPAYRP